MKITVLAVGKCKNTQIHALISEYIRMISSDADILIHEIKDSNSVKEAESMHHYIAKLDQPYVFVLSEEGKKRSSPQFAEELFSISQYVKHIVFCIGGPGGFEKPIAFGDDILSLSSMTMPHEMARLFLIEQIYRAIAIKKGKSYHRQ